MKARHTSSTLKIVHDNAVATLSTQVRLTTDMSVSFSTASSTGPFRILCLVGLLVALYMEEATGSALYDGPAQVSQTW